MSNKIKNQRIFFMLNREDAGFGTALDPSGYVKIEVREGKGRLSAMVQNLREDRLDYKLYLLWCSENMLFPVNVGSVPLKKNKGEINWEFIPENVANTGISIEKFNIAALLAENEEGAQLAVLCPLVAYKDKKLSWRDKVKEILYGRKEKAKAPVQEEPQKPQKPTVVNPVTTAGENEEETVKAPVQEEKAEVPDISALEEEAQNEWNGENVSDMNTQEAPPEGNPVNAPEILDINLEMPEEIQENQNEKPVQENPAGAEEEKNQEVPGTEDPQAAAAGNDYQDNCTYKKEEACPFLPEEGNSPCSRCQMNPGKIADTPSVVNNNSIDTLIKNLDQYFEKCNPFNSKRRDYRWWKVNSPVYLNNILFQCNIRTPLLFNPKVMMAHFKYRHLIAGIYIDPSKKRECIVCGIPGVYNIDEKPFGDLCRWVQIEGNKPRYGAFGYWLVYIDFKSGKFLNFA